jgi:hypothetical protein
MNTRNPAVTPEAPPQESSSPAVWPLVIADLPRLHAPEWLRQRLAADMQARNDFGREKYGTVLRVDNKRNAGNARQRLEQTGLPVWAGISGQALGLAAAIRYQLALEAEGEG